MDIALVHIPPVVARGEHVSERVVNFHVKNKGLLEGVKHHVRVALDKLHDGWKFRVRAKMNVQLEHNGKHWRHGYKIAVCKTTVQTRAHKRRDESRRGWFDSKQPQQRLLKASKQAAAGHELGQRVHERNGVAVLAFVRKREVRQQRRQIEQRQPVPPAASRRRHVVPSASARCDLIVLSRCFVAQQCRRTVKERSQRGPRARSLPRGRLGHAHVDAMLQPVDKPRQRSVQSLPRRRGF